MDFSSYLPFQPEPLNNILPERWIWQGREPGQISSSCISVALLGIKQGQKLNEAREVGGGQALGGPAGQDTRLVLNLLGR